jgi:hypothetical protein
VARRQLPRRSRFADRQRLVDIADLPEGPAIGAASQNSGAAMLITWRGEPKSKLGPARLAPRAMLLRRAPAFTNARAFSLARGMRRQTALDELRSSMRSRGRGLRAIADHRIALLHGVPAYNGQVLEVARLLGYVGETNYGRVFAVRSVVAPTIWLTANTAWGSTATIRTATRCPGCKFSIDCK